MDVRLLEVSVVARRALAGSDWVGAPWFISFLAFHQFSCRFPERGYKPLRNNKHIFVFAIIHQDHCGILTAASSFLSNYFSIFTQWLEFCGGWTNKKNIGTRTMSDTAENRNLTYFPSSPDLPGKPARTIEHCTTIENE